MSMRSNQECCRVLTGDNLCPEAESKEKHGVRMYVPYAGVDYNLSLCPLQSRLNTFTMGNPMP
jgi:hypothetical protein